MTGQAPAYILDAAFAIWHRPRGADCWHHTPCGETVEPLAIAFGECRAVDLRCNDCEEIFEDLAER